MPRIIPPLFPLRNMVEIECPLCAESIDLGMAEEGEYECPYCEDVFHWGNYEFSDMKKLQCPKGCGQLSYASFNPDLLLKSLAKRALMMGSGEIGYYECQKCKGSLLNAKNIGAILGRSDKVRTLESLLEQGVSCDLDCPTCEEKMVEINVYYEPSNPMDDFGGGGSDLVDLAIMLVIGIPVIAYQTSKHNYEGVGKATMILDGCGDCGSFWFDKGEIDKIRKADDVDGMGI